MTTILVVDDFESIRTFCERSLSGMRVLLAADCDEALRLYEKERVDVVLTDVRLAGDCGLALLKKIKAADPDEIVIIMTGDLERDVILEALKEGANDFISKPFESLQLRNAVENALTKKKLRSELADLKRLNKLKDNFLSIVSHKLLTPITSISLFLQGMEQDIATTGGVGLRQTLRQVGGETAYLKKLVSDLLMFSKLDVEDEALRLERLDLSRVVSEALQRSPEAQQKTHIETAFIRKPMQRVTLDRQKITFAIEQVIDNSFKFSGETGRVSVTLEQDGEVVRITINDTGAGIPASELKRVADKFYQVDPDNTGQVRGFGLGLYYARELVKQHGGSMKITSEPQQGTTVVIELPLQ